MVKSNLAGEGVAPVVNTGASAPVVGTYLVHKLVMWNRARKVKVRQGDGGFLRVNFVVNTTFNVMDSSSVLGKFVKNTEVLDIGNRKVILGLSWLMENAFLVDTQDRCLRNLNTGQVISSSFR